MSELKPVAWASVPDKINGHSYIKLGEDNPNEKIYTIPLYTKGQLQPRVQMTSELRDKFIDTRMKHATFYSFSKEIYEKGNLFYSLTEDDLMRAWLNPEETIEIVPDMKWFVRSKEKYQGFYMFLGDLNELRDPWIFTKQDDFTSFATQFDTKEEAEIWKNPLTEAVLLPIEGDD